MNFIRKFMRASATDEVAGIPMGKLFLARSPLLPKGSLECLYNDSSLTLKKTTTPFCYQLAVTKAYQEGELDEEEDDDDQDPDDTADPNDEQSHGDERLFFLTEELNVRLSKKPDGSYLITWKDMSGDEGERLEFVVDEEIKALDVNHFMMALYRCLYEQKYGKSAAVVPEDELTSEFATKTEQKGESLDVLRELKTMGTTYKPATAAETSEDDAQFADASNLPYHIFQEPSSPKYPLVGSFKVQLRVFEPDTDLFAILSPNVEVGIYDVPKEVSRLASFTDKVAFDVPIINTTNPAFNAEYCSFIFNYYSVSKADHVACYSLLFQFPSVEELDRFRVLFEQKLQAGLSKKPMIDAGDVNYIADSLQALDMNNISEPTSPDVSDTEDDGSQYDERINKIIRDQVQTKESRKNALFVDSDSDADEDDHVVLEKSFLGSREKNSGMAVGNANDRSYVTRGNQIGVFKKGDGLSFVTTINGVKDADGKPFTPKRNLLHQRDQYLLMTKDDELDSKIYKMDLSRGQIVETWDADAGGALTAFAPTSKFAPLSDEQTLLGSSSNSLFRIDPRLLGKKVVEDKSFKGYKTKVNFESMALTDNGYFAVGLKDGTIRLYERLGKKSTVTLPSIGERYVGLDVTKDGRWLLATCKTLLLLIDTKIGAGQKNTGELGFQKYFDADKKPTPRRLTLRPEHVSLITHATGGKGLDFTRAVFNTSLTQAETTIVTSTGPFIVLWSLSDLAKSKKTVAYKIYRYGQEVVAENFFLDSQNDIVTVLQNDVVTTGRKQLRMANKTTIVGSSENPKSL